MYSVRDYLVSFCNPSFGLKNEWLQPPPAGPGGPQFAALCIDVRGNTIVGGLGAFPPADLDAVISSEGYRLYEQNVMRRERLENGMAYDEFQRGAMTNKMIS